MNELFNTLARKVERAVGHPWTFLLACFSILVWGVTGPLFRWSDTWQMVINTGTTIVTFLMVFLIQATQSRDTTAIQLKLAELLRAVEGARTELGQVEDLSVEKLDELREEMREETQRNADP